MAAMTPDETQGAFAFELSQVQAGKLVGVDPRTVRRWAAGELPVQASAEGWLRMLACGIQTAIEVRADREIGILRPTVRLHVTELGMRLTALYGRGERLFPFFLKASTPAVQGSFVVLLGGIANLQSSKHHMGSAVPVQG